MAVTVSLPQMGESVVEGTVERWLVREGERVEKDQVICEVTTDKVDVEIPAPEAGVITQILVQEGGTIEVGAELAVVDPDAQAGASAPKSAPAPAGPAAPSVAPVAAVAAAGESHATPLARKIAETEGVSLDGIPGTGPDGRVSKSDVLQRLAGPAAVQPATSQQAGEAPIKPGSLLDALSGIKLPQYKPAADDTVVPFSTIRKRIAEHMIVSKIISPHVGTVAEIDLNRVSAHRNANKGAWKAEHGYSLTFLPYLIQATVRALREFPRVNSTVVGQNIVERRGIHIGVAVETEKGLVVPVLRDADRLSLGGVAQGLEELASKARNRQLSADDLHGGTFTVSNPGRQGNLYGFAVINQPQVGILRMGEVVKRPVVIEVDGNDSIAVRPMMYLALSYDHRIIDGVTGNGFLYRVAAELEAGDFDL